MTKAEYIAALEEIMGDDVVRLLRAARVGLPQITSMACGALMHKMSFPVGSPGAMVQHQMKALSSTGMFDFDMGGVNGSKKEADQQGSA